MNNQSTVETFAEWYRNQQPVLAAKPVHTSINYESQHCFLVLIPDMPAEERMRLAQFLLTDTVAEFEEVFGEPDV
jgi:hypothetical protein